MNQNPLTDEQLNQIEARATAATPAPAVSGGEQ